MLCCSWIENGPALQATLNQQRFHENDKFRHAENVPFENRFDALSQEVKRHA